MTETASSPVTWGRAYRWGIELALAAAVLLLTGAAQPTGPSELNLYALLLFGGGAAVAVLLRRRALPVAVILAASLVAAFPQTGVGLAVVAYTVGAAVMSPRRRAVLLAAIVVVPAVMTPVAIAVLEITMARVQVWAVVVTVLVTGVLPALVGILVRQRERLTVAWRDGADDRERAYRLAVSEARLRERSRIAGEMHDVLGHKLSLIALHAGGLELATAGADPEAYQAARLIRTTARQALDELRAALGILRADGPVPDLTALTGTRADVTTLLDESRAAGVPVVLDWTGDDLIGTDDNARRAVHRVVREALTNVHKHAPASTVAVRVTREPDRVRVEVRNTAQPSPGADDGGPSGGGLVGLHERVTLLGGSFQAGGTDDGGFAVLAEIPLPGAAPEPTDPVVPAHDTAPAGDATPAGDPAPVAGSLRPEPAGPPPSHRATRSRPELVAVGLVLGMMLLISLNGALLSLTSGIVYPTQSTSVPYVGMSRLEFLDSLGGNDPVAQLAVQGHEPPRPAGTSCDYQRDILGVGRSAAPGPAGTPVTLFRYCFASDRLVEIRSIDLTAPAK